MSAAAIETAAPKAFDGFVGQDRSAARMNPHAERYGYMPGCYSAQADARTTGHIFFQQGTLITFRTFPSGGHFNSAVIEDPKAPASRIMEITAEGALANAGLEYPVWDTVDQGFVGIPALTGNDRAHDYFNLLHPPFPVIGLECPSGLEVCPTCRKEWLESEASKRYFNENKYFDADTDVALKVKEALYASVTRFSNYCENAWGELADQWERSRNAGTPFVFDKSHQHTRKCIHAPSTEDRELNRLRAMTDANAEAIGRAVRGGAVNHNDFSDAELAMIYAERAKNGTKAPKGETLAPPTTDADPVSYAEGDNVLCEGSPGTITEVKTAGWFVVALESGVTTTVRKNKLEPIKENLNEQAI